MELLLSHWRCHLLSNAINHRNNEDPLLFPSTARMFYMPSALDWHHPAVQEKVGAADIIVFQRNVMFPQIWEIMQYWRALGKVVLVDLDDHYSFIPPSNPAYPYWVANVGGLDPDPLDGLKEGLKHADALIAPNTVLLKDWSHVVATYEWPNFPAIKDYKDLDNHRRPFLHRDPIYSYGDVRETEEGPKRDLLGEWRDNSEGKIVIGWGGSLSHVDSFHYSGVVDGLRRLMKEDPRVVFKFCGNDERLDFMWETLPEGQVWSQNGVSPYDWPRVVATFDIGIAPMDMRPVPSNTGYEPHDPPFSYDERRSWLKIVEYVCAGVPFVATRCQPYDRKELKPFMDAGALTPNGADEWYRALKHAVQNIECLRDSAAQARRYALTKLTQEANAHRLIDLYTRIGEEAQARQGLRQPAVVYMDKVSWEKGDREWEDPPPSRYTGDPLDVGVAPYTDAVHLAAKTWHQHAPMFHENADLGAALEYNILMKFNELMYAEIHKEAEGDGQANEASADNSGQSHPGTTVETTV